MFVCKIRTITFPHFIRPLFPSFKHYCLPILYVVIEIIFITCCYFFMRERLTFLDQPRSCQAHWPSFLDQPRSCRAHRPSFRDQPRSCQAHRPSFLDQPCSCRAHRPSFLDQPCSCRAHRPSFRDQPCSCRAHRSSFRDQPCSCRAIDLLFGISLAAVELVAQPGSWLARRPSFLPQHQKATKSTADKGHTWITWYP